MVCVCVCVFGVGEEDYSIGNKSAVAVREKCVCLVRSSVVRSGPPQSVAQSSPPGLPTENTHTRGVDADEAPGCPFLEDGQGTYEYVCVGAVGVPVATVDAQTARVARLGALLAASSPWPPPVCIPGASVRGVSAGGLVEELFLHHVVDCNVGQHCDLVPGYVCGLCQVAHPGVYAVTYWVLPSVHGVRPCSAPHPHPPHPFNVIALTLQGVVWRQHLAEDHAGRGAVASLGEELGVHYWDGGVGRGIWRRVRDDRAPVLGARSCPMVPLGPVVAASVMLLWRVVFRKVVPRRSLLLSCSLIGCRLLSCFVVGRPGTPGQSTSHVQYSLDADQEEQDQWWRPHGHTSWGEYRKRSDVSCWFLNSFLKLISPLNVKKYFWLCLILDILWLFLSLNYVFILKIPNLFSFNMALILSHIVESNFTYLQLHDPDTQMNSV